MSSTVGIGLDDLRGRISAVVHPKPIRLPWAIGGALLFTVSTVLWLDVFQVATTLARHLANVF